MYWKLVLTVSPPCKLLLAAFWLGWTTRASAQPCFPRMLPEASLIVSDHFPDQNSSVPAHCSSYKPHIFNMICTWTGKVGSAGPGHTSHMTWIRCFLELNPWKLSFDLHIDTKARAHALTWVHTHAHMHKYMHTSILPPPQAHVHMWVNIYTQVIIINKVDTKMVYVVFVTHLSLVMFRICCTNSK